MTLSSCLDYDVFQSLELGTYGGQYIWTVVCMERLRQRSEATAPHRSPRRAHPRIMLIYTDVMLLDVVPVLNTTIDEWQHPPFSGYFDGLYSIY
jgi:hypothetical protein